MLAQQSDGKNLLGDAKGSAKTSDKPPIKMTINQQKKMVIKNANDFEEEYFKKQTSLQNCFTSPSFEANLKECRVNQTANLYDTAANVMSDASELSDCMEENPFDDWEDIGTQFVKENLMVPLYPGNKNLQEVKFSKSISSPKMKASKHQSVSIVVQIGIN